MQYHEFKHNAYASTLEDWAMVQGSNTLKVADLDLLRRLEKGEMDRLRRDLERLRSEGDL